MIFRPMPHISMFEKLLITLFLLINTSLVYGQLNQSITSHIDIIPSIRESEQMLPFKGEGGFREGLPLFRFRIAVPASTDKNSLTLNITDLRWVSDNDVYIKEYPKEFKVPEKQLICIKKQSYVEVEIVPYTTISEKPCRLESFNLELSFSSIATTKATTEKYANSSVLASGNWLKVSVTETGIHKIPYSAISGWGFSDPSKVRIFGYGGEMLPKSNSEPRPDDLPEVAIWHYNNAIYFYAQGPVIWKWDDTKEMFLHQIHDYSDVAYYFLTDLSGSAKSIAEQTFENGTVNYTSTHFDDYKYHEQELNNLLKSGRRWYGEKFSSNDMLSREFNFSFPLRDVTIPVKISSRVVCRDNRSSSFKYIINDKASACMNLTTSAIAFSDNTGYYATESDGFCSFSDETANIKVSLSLLNTSGTVSGWLDYITLNARSNLKLTDNQLIFRDKSSQADGNITLFSIDNASDETVVWDITNRNSAEKIPSSLNSNTLEFKVSTSQLKEFAAFNPSGQFPVPEKIETVTNQNLHASQQVDYIIVTPKEFLSQANLLAALHIEKSGLSTLVVTPETIYNEFSWGHKDPTAIRSFLKMLYDRAGDNESETPKYLLLFGDGSYDNRTDDENAKSHIITYQSENSIHRTNTYITDDYFGFLDDAEGSDDQDDRPDIGIGRIPVNSATEAQNAYKKSKFYIEQQATGEWRKLVTFVGDDEDSNIHMRDANLLAEKVENNNSQFDVRRIFLDNYTQTTTTSGEEYPDAEEYINRTISEGTLIFNYVGHGNAALLAAEEVINITSIRAWNNISKLPVFVTATCEFSRFDDPSEVSAGEELFLSTNGGAIALLSTSRIVFSSLNYQLNNAFFDYVFTHDSNGEKPSLGDIILKTKTASGNSINKLNFSLLGDPALKLIYPENKINITKINNKDINEECDTLKALSKIVLEAEIVDKGNNILESFNGTAAITVYDKPVETETLGNDGSTPFEFSEYSRTLFNGEATVTNGRFTSEFIIPFDIPYNYAPGRISLYAYSSVSDEAFGANNDIIVGGLSLASLDDPESPNITLYLDNESFNPGDKTGTTPVLYAVISDNSGINTSGYGIGHDITLIIDEDTDNPVILNDYYQAKSDTYKDGVLIYQLSELTEGAHTISLKVWDTYNNSAIAETWFTVGDTRELKIFDFKCYPNPLPANGTLWYSFKMDDPNSTISITIETINLGGNFLGRNKVQITSSNNDIAPIALYLSNIGINKPGIYFIRFQISTSSGRRTQVVQKIMVHP